jgi:hypothetical protein
MTEAGGQPSAVQTEGQEDRNKRRPLSSEVVGVQEGRYDYLIDTN